MAIWSRFFGSAVSTGVGVAIGNPVSATLEPIVQELANLTWAETTKGGISRPLDVGVLASGVAQGQIGYDAALGVAHEAGFSQDRFDKAVAVANVGPGVALAYQLWRRGVIGEPGFRRAVKRLGLEQEWIDDLVALHDVLLTPAELAAARVKGHIGPQRQYDESELQGITNERAEILYQTTGNPPGPETLQQMFNRHIIGPDEFTAGIRQGNIRPEWRDELFAMREHLLTPAEIVNLRLRGWRGDQWMYDRGAELGFTQERMHELFLGQGRPISFHQVFIGERRGGTYDGPTGGIDAAFLKSLEESNIRPEWYNLAWAQRHAYPSAFVLRSLAQSGDLTPEQTRTVLTDIGWPEWLITAVVAKWTGATTTTTDPRVKSAETAVLTQIRNVYMQQRADEGQARGWMGALGLDTATQDGLIRVWNVGREVPGSGLTRTQVKKAWQNLPAEWPRTRALAELEALGMEPDEAQTFLDE